MKIFYSSFRYPRAKTASRWITLFLVLLGLALILGAACLVYLVFKFVFGKSFLLGVLFLFFGLPLIGRLLFILFLSILPSLLTLLFHESKDDREAPKAKDDVIDVKYKIVK